MTDKISTNLRNVVSLVNETSELELEGSETLATVLASNPAVRFVKFILTDDLPNSNKQRVPLEEFDNIIKTGVFMPIKMAFSKINDGHEDSFPIGVITNLAKIGNQIKAIAALWSKERPEDIDLLKKRIAAREPVDISWEILFSDSHTDGDGVESLLGTSLRAATIVGMPAYSGRTPVLAVAARGSKAYLESLDENSFLYTHEGARLFPYKDSDGEIDITALKEAISSISEDSGLNSKTKKALLAKANKILAEELQAQQEIINTEETKLDKLEELQTKVSELETLVGEKDSLLTEANSELTKVSTKLDEANTELTALREFKSTVEAEKEAEARLDTIKTKFSDAGLTRSDEYFAEKKEALLALTDEAMDFMIQDLVAFASNKQEDKKKEEIPPIPGEESKEVTLKDMVEFLNRT